MQNLHTSLPIEYELKYGTPCGYFDVSNGMGNPPAYGISGIDGAFPQEKLLCDFWINPSPVTIDRFDPFLIGLNRR